MDLPKAASILLGPENIIPIASGEKDFIALLQKQGDPVHSDKIRHPLRSGRRRLTEKERLPQGIPGFLKEGYAYSGERIAVKGLSRIPACRYDCPGTNTERSAFGDRRSPEKRNDWIPDADLALAIDLNKKCI